MPPTPSAHRLRLGLPGYLILFAPLAFAPERQYQARWAFRHWCSSRYQCISPLHREFPHPLLYSSPAVWDAVPWLSQGISHSTYKAACTPFTPSDSEQRSLPPYYRGCWHGVGRSFLWRYRQTGRLFTYLPFFPLDRALQPNGLHRPRGVARSGFPPLPKPLDCCLP